MQKIIIIFGMPRSGTTLLATLLGAHPDISMLNESYNKDFEKLVGTKYIGNKVILNTTSFSRRSVPVIGAIINRLINFGSKFQVFRLFPINKLSILDYYKNGAQIILITRDEESIINSNIKRGKVPKWLMKHKYKMWSKDISKINERIKPLSVQYDYMINNPKGFINHLLWVLDIRSGKNIIESMINSTDLNNTYKLKL